MKTMILSLVLASIAGLMYCSDESVAVTQEPEDKELRAMQEKRRNTLQEVVRILEVRFETGTIQFDGVWRANVALLEAKLELAESQQERISIFETMLETQTKMERIQILMRESGAGPGPEVVLNATAARIKAEIDLYKAKKGI